MEDTRKTILIIEDEAGISELLSYALRREGYKTIAEFSGYSGMDRLKSEKVDLLLLDLMLPDINGIDICRTVKSEYKIPVIILTAKSDIVDKVTGFSFGADDYITKPFDIREVIARVNAAFRRIEEIESKRQHMRHIKLRMNIDIYTEERKVTKDGQVISLTPKEFDLLHLLARNKNVVFTRDKLLDLVWGYDYAIDTRSVDIHILRLRKKIGDCNGMLIKTVFGVGYKLDN
ncbi:MAG TPA: response regulator transcription factor [Pseudobacteroides sp.]|nr:response regulator transcription factor [Pseudobacteroides sp.]